MAGALYLLPLFLHFVLLSAMSFATAHIFTARDSGTPLFTSARVHSVCGCALPVRNHLSSPFICANFAGLTVCHSAITHLPVTV